MIENQVNPEAEKFISIISTLVAYWKEQPGTTDEKIDGVVFSILAHLDGSGLETYKLSRCIWNKNGDKIIKTTEPFNGSLHELFDH